MLGKRNAGLVHVTSSEVVIVINMFSVDDELKGVTSDLAEAGVAAVSPNMFCYINSGLAPVSKKGMEPA